MKNILKGSALALLTLAGVSASDASSKKDAEVSFVQKAKAFGFKIGRYDNVGLAAGISGFVGASALITDIAISMRNGKSFGEAVQGLADFQNASTGQIVARVIAGVGLVGGIAGGTAALCGYRSFFPLANTVNKNHSQKQLDELNKDKADNAKLKLCAKDSLYAYYQEQLEANKNATFEKLTEDAVNGANLIDEANEAVAKTLADATVKEFYSTTKGLKVSKDGTSTEETAVTQQEVEAAVKALAKDQRNTTKKIEADKLKEKDAIKDQIKKERAEKAKKTTTK